MKIIDSQGSKPVKHTQTAANVLKIYPLEFTTGEKLIAYLT